MPQSPLHIGSFLERLGAEHRLLIGRGRELDTLRDLIRDRRSVFISGPSGIGKTALVHAAYAEWNADHRGAPLFYCGESRTRRDIATHVLVNLLLQRGRLESRYADRRKKITSLRGLRRFTAGEHLPDLKRMMHQNLLRDRTCLVLDHLDRPDPHVASLIEVWLESMPLVLVARDSASMGRGRWLLSSVASLPIDRLDRAAMLELARALPDTRGLKERHLDEAVDRAAGNPGRLSELLRAAARPEYRTGREIHWNLLELDLRIEAIGLPGRGA